MKLRCLKRSTSTYRVMRRLVLQIRRRIRRILNARLCNPLKFSPRLFNLASKVWLLKMISSRERAVVLVKQASLTINLTREIKCVMSPLLKSTSLSSISMHHSRHRSSTTRVRPSKPFCKSSSSASPKLLALTTHHLWTRQCLARPRRSQSKYSCRTI